MPGLNLIPSSGIEACRHLCPECKLILKDPVQTVEGVRLCRTCYNDIARQPGYTSPHSGVSVQAEDGNLAPCFVDKAAQREILQLQVQCGNKEFGCKWSGRLSDYADDHEHACTFRPVSCPNSCGELVPKKELEKHLEHSCLKRFVQCNYCTESLIAIDLEAHHNKDCSKYPVKCELCSSDVPRLEMEEHGLKNCEYIQCTCKEVLNRSGDASDPKSVAVHFENPAAILQHLLSLFSMGSQLVQSINNFNKRLEVVESEGTSTEIAKLSQDLSQLKQITDKRFSSVVKQIEQLEQNQAHQSKNNKNNLTQRVEDLLKKIQQLEDKSMRQTVEIKTLQTELQHHQTSKSVSTWDIMPMTSGKRHSESMELVRLSNLEKRYEDMERQVTMLKVHVSEMELQLQASLASTYNGSFMWRIPDIKKRRRDAIDGRITSLYSPPFYTAKNGYKMCIRVYLNGDGMGHKTHLSIFFVLMKGEFDALLKWPFENKVSLILVDQNHRKHLVQTFKPTPESSSFQRPISDMNVASGCPQFCKLSYLDDDNYTKDDTLFIKCIVDTSSIFHP